jgi:hypothetical protein
MRRFVLLGFVLAVAAITALAQDQQQAAKENPDVPMGCLRFDLGIVQPAGIKATCGKLGLALPLYPRVTVRFAYEGWRFHSADVLNLSPSWELSFSFYIRGVPNTPRRKK